MTQRKRNRRVELRRVLPNNLQCRSKPFHTRLEDCEIHCTNRRIHARRTRCSVIRDARHTRQVRLDVLAQLVLELVWDEARVENRAQTLGLHLGDVLLALARVVKVRVAGFDLQDAYCARVRRDGDVVAAGRARRDGRRVGRVRG
jgi:hypothetical protein